MADSLAPRFRLAALIVVGLVVAGLATLPSLPDRPGATDGPVVSQPWPDASGLATIVGVTRDDMDVTMELDGGGLIAGEAASITIAVTNIGDDDVIWTRDCEDDALVTGAIELGDWHDGLRHGGFAAHFKRTALEWLPVGDAEGLLRFVVDPPDEPIECVDGVREVRIGPGAKIEERALWDGYVWERRGPPPAGPVRLQGRIHVARESDPPLNPDAERRDRKVDLLLDAWVDPSLMGAFLSPSQIVDAALLHPGFADRLFAGPQLGGTTRVILRYDPTTGTWLVGTLERQQGRLIAVVLDPGTGRVLELVDRHWDEDADGDP